MPLGIRLTAGQLLYDGMSLFDKLDVGLAAGRITCLLGPSGIGKSSLLRLLAGLVPPGDSRVTCDDGKPLAGRVALMDQRDLLLPWLNVIENVTLGSRLRGEPVDQARAEMLLQEVGMADRAQAMPRSLSGGMRQRVALARTLMEDRPVVLMDEPFSSLDAITRFRLQALAARLLAGRTVLLVTHDPVEALRLGHHIHVMAGRPARLDAPLAPPGEAPRDVTAPALLDLQRELMARLGAADVEAA